MLISAPILLENVSKNREAFMALRKNHIGASEIPAILGLNKYESALDLWMLKTGRKNPMEDNDRLWYGREHEHLVAKLFERRMGMKVAPVDNVYQHPLIPWLMVSPDWIAVDESCAHSASQRLLECKTVGFGSRDDWSETKAPDAAAVQLVTQMACTGVLDGHCCSIVAGDVEKAFFPRYTFDFALWDAILPRIVHFWECVQSDKLPDMQAGDLKTLHELLPATNPDELELDDANGDVSMLITQKRLVSDYSKALKRETDRFDALKAKVRAAMGNHAKARFGDVTFDIKDIAVRGYEVKQRVDTRFTIKLPKEVDE